MKYFQDSISITELSNELVDMVESKGNVHYYNIQDNSDKVEFDLERQHLIKLCMACIENKISTDDLTKIAFVLMASDYFVWDNSSSDGEVIDQIITNWDNPEINGELTLEYIQYCAYYLETGEHK